MVVGVGARDPTPARRRANSPGVQLAITPQGVTDEPPNRMKKTGPAINTSPTSYATTNRMLTSYQSHGIFRIRRRSLAAAFPSNNA